MSICYDRADDSSIHTGTYHILTVQALHMSASSQSSLEEHCLLPRAVHSELRPPGANRTLLGFSHLYANRGGQGAADLMISLEILFFLKRFHFDLLLDFMFPL